ncbi:hypothetical protein FSP39_013766 [Pinctada imbricata]|uniref:Uncharacterized protein n=1 Tax=Pinctada imbricata TaxID=66713 RepID=A0AA88XNK3_PINIB|nr:hypothetical protein FSP39_013766 [Pinctada imbricata]
MSYIYNSGPHRPLWPVYGEYLYLPPQRWVHSLEPYALVTYKCKLMMDKIDLDTAVDFIRTTALRAPERRVWRDGDYSFGILEEARTVPGSDQKDDVICPTYHPQFTGPGTQ